MRYVAFRLFKKSDTYVKAVLPLLTFVLDYEAEILELLIPTPTIDQPGYFQSFYTGIQLLGSVVASTLIKVKGRTVYLRTVVLANHEILYAAMCKYCNKQISSNNTQIFSAFLSYHWC